MYTHIYSFRRDKLLYHKLEICDSYQDVKSVRGIQFPLSEGIALFSLKMKYCTTLVLSPKKMSCLVLLHSNPIWASVFLAHVMMQGYLQCQEPV